MKKPHALLPHHGRHLSLEEIDLWLYATRAVQPRHNRHNLAPPLPPPQHASKKISEAAAGKPSAAGPPPVLPLAPLERRLRQRLQRGQTEVHGVIDLHGMRQVEAHRALRNFLRQAQANGARVVLVITGKGSSSRAAAAPIETEGVLRRSVPQWLQAAELRSVVIGFEQAGIAHGGAGALYVRIRRVGAAGTIVR
jgi:DNA-nicking Smr family endonuclease